MGAPVSRSGPAEPRRGALQNAAPVAYCDRRRRYERKCLPQKDLKRILRASQHEVVANCNGRSGHGILRFKCRNMNITYRIQARLARYLRNSSPIVQRAAGQTGGALALEESGGCLWQLFARSVCPSLRSRPVLFGSVTRDPGAAPGARVQSCLCWPLSLS